jgi:hypothetical protein
MASAITAMITGFSLASRPGEAGGTSGASVETAMGMVDLKNGGLKNDGLKNDGAAGGLPSGGALCWEIASIRGHTRRRDI